MATTQGWGTASYPGSISGRASKLLIPRSSLNRPPQLVASLRFVNDNLTMV